MPEHGHAHEDGHGHDGEYDGPATIVVEGTEVVVRVRLGCRHEPFDGRLHWAGRVSADPRLSALAGTGADVEVRTDSHAAAGRLADPDMWDRYRLTGVGRPPFAVDLDVEVADGERVDS